MKTVMFKIAVIFLLSFTLVQNSDAFSRFYDRCEPAYYHGPYVEARFCHERVFIPGHFIINRYGERVWVRAGYRR